jgi:hypothetical protein
VPREKGLFARVRDYAAEYVARVARARERGFTGYAQERRAGGAKAPAPGRAPPTGPPSEPPPKKVRDYHQEWVNRQAGAQAKGYTGNGERDRMYGIIKEGLLTYVGDDGRALTESEFALCTDLLKQCSDELVAARARGEDPHLSAGLKRQCEREMGQFMRFPDIWSQMKALYFGLKLAKG